MFYATTNKDNCNADWALSESRRPAWALTLSFSSNFAAEIWQIAIVVVAAAAVV